MVKKHENKLISDHVLSSSKEIEHLKSIDFDTSMSSMLPFEQLVMKNFAIPNLKWSTYLPDPIITILLQYPWDLSSSLPGYHPSSRFLIKTGHKFVVNRALTQWMSLNSNFVIH